jgi:myo-inositol 2-dehydrogenase / D-chiro-inositol 1-dehydrogenase
LSSIAVSGALHCAAVSPAEPLRIAVAGCGEIGLLHAQNVLALDSARLVAMASTGAARAAELAAQLGDGVRGVSHEELLALDDVDAVVLATRSREHAARAIALIEAGKHVLLEKPGATTLADHALLRAAAEAHPGVLVRVAYMRRFDADFREAARLVREGAIGRPLLALLTSRDMEWPANDDPADSGGFLLDMAVHDYDTACWILGQRPAAVSVARQGLVHPELLEMGDLDNALVTIRFDEGALASSHISRVCAFGQDIRCEFVGSEGSVFVGDAASAPGVTAIDASGRPRFPADYRERFAGAYRAELAHFVAECRGDPLDPAIQPATLDDDHRAVEVGIAARAGAVRGKELKVGPDWPWP